MTGWRAVALVARREVVARARSRAFLASTALTVLVVLLVVAAPALLGRSTEFDVALAGDVPAAFPAAVEQQAAAQDVAVRTRVVPEVSTAETALRDGTVDAVVVDGDEVVWLAEPDEVLQPVLAGALALVQVSVRAERLGVPPATAAALLAPADTATRSLEPVSEDLEARQFAALIVVVLLLMALNVYGGFVLTGVVEEKSSRVVELLLARVPARQLLAGKVMGIGLLGLTQVLLIGVAALVAIAVAPRTDLELPRLDAGLVAWCVVWFLLGYALYSMVYGAFGALASRAEDAQSVATPLTVTLLAAYFLTIAVVSADESSAASVALGLFPLTAPMAMPMRLAVGFVPAWELLLSIALMLLSTYGVSRLAGRVYSGAALRTGGRVALVDAWRAARAD